MRANANFILSQIYQLIRHPLTSTVNTLNLIKEMLTRFMLALKQTGRFLSLFAYATTQTIAHYIDALPTPQPPSISALSADNAIPIILLHGFGDSSKRFTDLREHLASFLPNPPGPVFALEFKRYFQGIPSYSEELLDFVLENKISKLILVGHSMGGLVICDFLINFARQHNITVVTAITIASPIGGTYMALPASIMSQSARQMLKCSSYINNILRDLQETNVPIYHIVAGKDFWVANHSAFSPTGSSEAVFFLADAGHVDVLYLPETAYFIAQKIIKHTAVYDKKKSTLNGGQITIGISP